METSILNDIKQLLGISPTDASFDGEIVLYINSAFSTLHQLGVGPPETLSIEGDVATWVAFTGGDRALNLVKTYVHTFVRLIFDPPQTAHLLTSMKEIKAEQEWRLKVYQENHPWSAVYIPQNTEFVLDGGAP